MYRKDAQVVLCRCNKAHKTYGIRFERNNNEWLKTWAFKINEAMAAREGYDNDQIVGMFYSADDYPGCPYCGESDLIICGCGRIGCYIVDAYGNYSCEWCGNTGPVEGDYDGSGILSEHNY